MDETEMSNVQNPFKIVARKGAKKFGKIASEERDKSVTVT